jgi:O-antigen ligase
LTLLLAASIAFGLAFPKLAIHQDTASELLNAWHGLAQQKNAFGGMASFAFILWLHAWMTRDTNRLLAVVGGAVSGACIVLSRSSTSLMATIFASLVMMILMRSPGSLRRSLPYLVAALAAVIILYSLAMLRILPGSDLLLSPVPMLTGKDLTFSGRSEIWAAIATHIQQRPILGSGYGAYWSPGTPKPGEESYVLIKILQGFYPASSHNGYLDVLNDLGAIGLLCLGGFLVVYVRQSLRLMKVDRAQGALFVVLFFQQTIDNLSESDWFFVTSLNFMLMSLATVSIARALVEARNPNAARVRRGAPVPVVPRRATVDHSAPPRRLMRPRY